MNHYEELNEQMVAAMKRLDKAVAAKDLAAVDYEDNEIQRLLGEMKAELNRW
jgi:hypothetical protein